MYNWNSNFCNVATTHVMKWHSNPKYQVRRNGKNLLSVKLDFFKYLGLRNRKSYLFILIFYGCSHISTFPFIFIFHCQLDIKGFYFIYLFFFFVICFQVSINKTITMIVRD